MALVALLVIVIAAGFPLLSTGLRSIDDHEYLTFRLMNPSGSLWTALLDASYRSFGEVDGARWRPLYHLGRSFTSALISDATSPRYLWRLVLTAFVTWGIATRIVQLTKPTYGNSRTRFLAIFTSGLLLLSVAEWADVTARLGPQELFALSGMTLTSFGIRVEPQFRHKLITITGVLVMCGYKENFAVLASLLLVGVLIASRPFRRQKLIFLCLGVSVASSAIAYTSVKLNGGADFYGQERSLESVAKGLISVLDSARFEWSAALLAVILAAGSRSQRALIAWLGLCSFSLLTTEWLFYGDDIELYGRYAIVSNLLIGALLVIVLNLFFSRAVLRPRLKAYVLSCLLVLASVLVINMGEKIRKSADTAAEESASWTEAVDQIIDETERANISNLLIIVDLHNNPGRYEKSLSLSTFLSFYAKTQPNVYLAVQDPPRSAEPSSFSEGLEAYAMQGDAGSNIWRTPSSRLQPITELLLGQRALCVHYSSSGREHRYSASCAESIRFTQ